MKKVVIGFIAGALFMVSAQAFGDGISFIGKKVEGEAPVTINGKVVGDAIIIKGKSFAPVRDLTNGFGGKVDSASSGGIALSTDKANEKVVDDNSIQIIDLQNKIASKKADIESIKQKIEDIQKKVDERKAQGISADVQMIELATMKQELENQIGKLTELEYSLKFGNND
ncbi:hypothetical protein [Paenibacillus cellulositrophicus]|uniref:hypothetical protein n=1 Tax=Paenibacillus cellulositrophicus TaxID=562959 RepID=UPI0012676B9A|nr:hypothetical protein [Paenibacillus cellulositrophicus]